jgi:osmotically-inducible protein OsmY
MRGAIKGANTPRCTALGHRGAPPPAVEVGNPAVLLRVWLNLVRVLADPCGIRVARDRSARTIAMKTDREIQEQVLAALEWEPGVHAAHIGVSVRSGVVTLQGFVRSLREKRLAEQIAERVYSVRAVADDLEVTPGGALKRSDQAIAEAAANALEWESAVPDAAVKAVVRKGWVTLTGTVAAQYQKAAAERAVQSLERVEGISNRILVEPSVDVGDVKAGIEQALTRVAEVEAEQVQVEAHNGTVVLFGKVHSLTERDAAENRPGPRRE